MLRTCTKQLYSATSLQLTASRPTLYFMKGFLVLLFEFCVVLLKAYTPGGHDRLLRENAMLRKQLIALSRTRLFLALENAAHLSLHLIK